MFGFCKTVFIDTDIGTDVGTENFHNVKLKSIEYPNSLSNPIEISFPSESLAIAYAREENFEVIPKLMALAIEEIFTH